MAESGQELRPEAKSLFEARRELRGFDGVVRKCRRDQGLGDNQGFVADHGAGAHGGLLLRGFAEFELQAPAMLALFRVGPDFERADFGEFRA